MSFKYNVKKIMSNVKKNKKKIHFINQKKKTNDLNTKLSHAFF